MPIDLVSALIAPRKRFVLHLVFIIIKVVKCEAAIVAGTHEKSPGNHCLGVLRDNRNISFLVKKKLNYD